MQNLNAFHIHHYNTSILELLKYGHTYFLGLEYRDTLLNGHTNQYFMKKKEI